MEHHPTLKIKANIDNVVEFLYDSPKEGTNDFGMWHRYALKHNGNEVGLFATDALHAKLMNFTTGDRVNIRKEEYEPNKYGWNVIPEEGTPARNTGTPSNINGSYKSTPSATTQERTKDIHRQVCLKLAVQSMGTPETLDLAIVKQRMEGLLDVLDGKETDSLPF